MARDGVAGVDQCESITGNLADGVFQERVVRAAMHEGVGACIQDRLQIGLQQLQHGGRARVATFDQRHQAIARLAQHLAIARDVAQQARKLLAAQRAFRCQHTHHTTL